MKRSALTALAAGTAFLGLAGTGAFAQKTMSGSHMGMRHQAMQGLSPLDKTFIKDTAQSNLGELKYAPLVEKMAERPESKQFAQKMVQDHSKAQKELKTLAASKSCSLPSDTDKTEKQVIHRLSRESKGRFDAAYKHEMIRDHTGDIAKTRREISLGRDKDVKSYAEKLLPVLQDHLKMAKALPAGSPMASKSSMMGTNRAMKPNDTMKSGNAAKSNDAMKSGSAMKPSGKM